MKAMVLAAGLGTRLRPLTERWPKPAIPFLGQPLLRYTFATLKAAGVTAVGLNTHHLPEVMERTARAEAERFGLGLMVVHEQAIQGTGGGIRGLRELLEPEATFIVFNGDILFPVDLRPLLQEHRASGAHATMLVMPMPRGEAYGAVELDAGGRVRRIAGHGPGGPALSSWHFTGVHLMSPAVFEHMRPSGPEDINRDVYVRMMEKGLTVRGAVVQSYWSDLGTPARYLATQGHVLDGQVSFAACPDASPFQETSPLTGHRVLARLGAKVQAKAVGPALFEAGCSVPSSARVGGNVYVGPDLQVPEGCRINRATVFEEAVLRPGEELVDALAWRHHRIAV